MQKLNPVVITAEELLSLVNHKNVVLIDASAGSHERYLEQHLKGALFADVNTDLAHIEDFAVGGRHPLPTFEQFTAVLAKLGIGPESHVVVYDDKNGGNAAARLWWMLRAIGHEAVQVLSGGFQAAVRAGFPLSSAIETAGSAAPYPVTGWNLPLFDINDVELARKDEKRIVIDVRDKNRYDGLTEPIDLIAGHIPGAINVPFTENLDENGLFLSPEVLKAKYEAIIGDLKPADVIIHCGSGITACHSLLALDHAGITGAGLYVGSWSEWSRNDRELALADPKTT